jgi:hypothetical protein
VVPLGQDAVLALEVSDTPLLDPLTLKAGGAFIGVVPLTVAEAALCKPAATAYTLK